MIPQSDEEIIETYLLCLSRPPSDGEPTANRDVRQHAREERRAAIEDLFWALMTSREFLFQH